MHSKIVKKQKEKYMSRPKIVKTITKHLKNNKVLSYVLKNMLYLYLRLLFKTYRIKVEFDTKADIPFKKWQGMFYFWHQNIIPAMFFFFKNKSIGHCIVSPSKDGQIVGFLAGKLGFKVLYGSAYKKSVKVVRKALDILDDNKRLCIVGDGSRGPAFKLQRGVIYLASKSKIPLVFIECKTKWAFTVKNSWDNFKIPLPYSKIFIKVHDPVMPSSDAYKNFEK